MKKLLLCALIVLMCVGTLFAGGGRDRGSASGKQRVAVALSPANNAWHARLRQVIDAAVANYPEYEWTVRNASDPNDQLNMLTVFKNERYDAMLIVPSDGNLLTPICESIYFEGTKTIILNRAIASQNFTAFVAGDNYGGGVNAARLLGERLGGRGNVAVLRSYAGTPIDVDRANGFKGTLAREFPDIRIIVEGDGEFNREAGLRAMTNILPGYPQIDAVYTQDDEAALGALTAIANAGRRDIRFITGFGGTMPTYEKFLANDPVYIASMSYFPSMGYDGVEMVVRVLKGIPFPKTTNLGSVAVGAWNVRDFMDDAY